MKSATRRCLPALLLCLVGVACGTRQSHEEIRAAAGASAGRISVSGPAEQQPTGDGDVAVSGPADVASEGVAVGLDRRVGGAARAGGRSSGGTGSQVEARTSAGARSPLRLAVVGAQSGVVGSVFAPIVQALQIWVQHINGRGGINGHLLQVEFVDDGADPARAKAAVRDQVERRGVLALLNNLDALSGAGNVEYITQKRVPVVGSEGASPGMYRSPMYFPQMTSAPGIYIQGVASIAEQVTAEQRQHFGTLVCVESTTCTDGDGYYAREAPGLGMRQVYRARASLAQPDFTAECLAARNAGVQVLLVQLDAASLERIAASCTRQAYRPTFASLTLGVVAREARNPSLDGLVASSSVFPYFQRGTPATDEFHAVMQRFAPKSELAVGHASGWVSGKLFERAAANLPEPPTREAVLDALWRIQNDTLGGLTLPLTYVRERPTKMQICWFDLVVRHREWGSPDGNKLHCR